MDDGKINDFERRARQYNDSLRDLVQPMVERYEQYLRKVENGEFADTVNQKNAP